jgi:hypothetical protein
MGEKGFRKEFYAEKEVKGQLVTLLSINSRLQELFMSPRFAIRFGLFSCPSLEQYRRNIIVTVDARIHTLYIIHLHNFISSFIARIPSRSDKEVHVASTHVYTL